MTSMKKKKKLKVTLLRLSSDTDTSEWILWCLAAGIFSHTSAKMEENGAFPNSREQC